MRELTALEYSISASGSPLLLARSYSTTASKNFSELRCWTLLWKISLGKPSAFRQVCTASSCSETCSLVSTVSEFAGTWGY